MSTGYQIVDVVSVNPGKPYDEATQSEGIPVEYTAPSGKRIVACHLSYVSGAYGSGSVASFGRPNHDGSGWSGVLSPNMAYPRFDGTVGPTPPDITNTFRYILVDGGIPALAAPTNFTAQVNANRTVQLAWSPVPGATGYKIYETTMSPNGVATVTTTTSLRGPLAPGQYEYYVRALDDTRESGDSCHRPVTVRAS